MGDELDDRARKIIAYIIAHPEAEHSEIAQDTGIPLPTVEKRMASYVGSDGFVSRFLVIKDWKRANYPITALVSIKVHQRNLSKGQGGPMGSTLIDDDENSPLPLPPPIGKHIRTQRELALYIKNELPAYIAFGNNVIVEKVSILLGHQSDLAVLVHARDLDDVFNFVTNGLRVLGGVQETMTSQEGWFC